jgi:hypothetical protein
VRKKLKYMFRDPRNDMWRYKRQFSDGTWFNRALGAEDQTLAEEQWPRINAKFEREAHKKARLAKYKDSKEARREKFWEALARFLIAEKRGNGGRLPRPPEVELPTALRLTSHPFVYVRNRFRAWAEEHDPDAIVVLGMGDMNANESTLFMAGIVAAYFTVSEMERLEAEGHKVQRLRQMAV